MSKPSVDLSSSNFEPVVNPTKICIEVTIFLFTRYTDMCGLQKSCSCERTNYLPRQFILVGLFLFRTDCIQSRV